MEKALVDLEVCTGALIAADSTDIKSLMNAVEARTDAVNRIAAISPAAWDSVMLERLRTSSESAQSAVMSLRTVRGNAAADAFRATGFEAAKEQPGGRTSKIDYSA